RSEKIENLERLKELSDLLKTKKQIAINLSADKINVAFDEKTEYEINLSDTFLPDVLNDRSCIKVLEDVLKDNDIEKVVYDAKGLSCLLGQYEAVIYGVKYDISIMKYLSGDILKDSLADVIYSEGLNSETPASGLFMLKNIFLEKLQKFDALKLYDVELKLFEILIDMEKTGFKIDAAELENFERKYSKLLADLSEEIYTLAGCKLNLNSPKQISEILFTKLNLKSGKKNKTGFSTDIEVLESLADEHEVIGKLIKYRQFSKLYNTYILGLKNVMDKKTNLVHTVFKQTLTSTGRLSSIEPNLQNIPVREEEGLKIRKLFIKSGEKRLLIAADYSQIELRLLAHFSDDEKLIDAFSKNLDIHAITAGQVFNVEPKKVSPKMRREAKAVNFGIIYGISDFGLSKQLEVPVGVAKSYIKKYFETYPKIKEYLNDNVEFAKKHGYSKTMFNRIRFIKDINSSNYNLRSFSERAAMNMPLQGTAADILKIAMVDIYENFQKQNLKSKMILSVHDEIIIDAEISECEKVEKILKDCMENAAVLKVPLTVSVKKGDSWYDAE
ncbi:MAG: DNA polymerase, partial [Firmicutes bacterium]|nr:DNA polymerase [Bacillota bacterium]